MSTSAGVGPRLARTAAVVLALAGPAVATAQASAATLSVGRACYVNADPGVGAPIAVGGTGYTPGDQIEIDGTGVFATATASPSGDFLLVTPGPILATTGPGQHTFALTASDATSGAENLATTAVTMANLSVGTTPATAPPGRTVAWHFSGFTPGRMIWAHYLHHGKAQAKVKMGRARGACGLLTARRKQFATAHPRYSSYQVVVDQVKRYSKRAVPKVLLTLSFF